MTGKVRLNLSVEAETIESLRTMAAIFGFITRSGRHPGEGNISALLDALGAHLLGVYDARGGESLTMTMSAATAPRDTGAFLALLDKIRDRVVAEMAERQLQRSLDLGPDGESGAE